MKKIYLIPVVILLFACNSTKKTSESKSKMSLYTTLYSAQYQGKETESNIIIDSQKELEELYASVGKEEIPNVDFSKNKVVSLFLGTKNTGGYSILIDKVEEQNGKIFIYKKVETPQGMATMALTNPFVIAEIHSKKEIIFK